jgi:hypothetical protein
MTVEQRGRCVCVLHGHPKKAGSKTDKPKGSIIKCYCGADMKDNWKKAEAMHYAITQSQKKRR